MEGGRRFETRPIESPEAARARLEDARIRAALANPKDNADLFKADVISWLRGSIGLRTERGASEISNRELMVRYVKYGKYEWDPLVAKSVAAHLKQNGFLWSP